MAVHPISTHIVTAQPAILTSPLNPKVDMWTSGIFNCCDDMGTCCFGFWCPCCQACQLSSDFGECMCMPMVNMMTCGMVPAYTMALRSSMRERYHLQGSMFDDCCIVTFCGSCAWCQMARELKRRKGLLLHTTTTTIHSMPQAPTYIANPMHPIPAVVYPPNP